MQENAWNCFRLYYTAPNLSILLIFRQVFAEGLRTQLKWLQSEYNLPILITENGFSSVGYELNDRERVKFLREHLQQVSYSFLFYSF